MGMGEVLIIDDDKSYQDLLSIELIKRGFQVEKSSDPEEALSFLKSHTPNIILLDIGLPLMDGFQLCAVIKGEEKSAMARVILMTADMIDNRSYEKASIVGAERIISKSDKPFEVFIENLIRCIEHPEFEYGKAKGEMDKPNIVSAYRDILKNQLDMNIRYKQILNEIEIGIMIIDRNKRIIFVNKKAEKILNEPASKLIGIDFTRLHKEENRENVLRYFEVIASPAYTEPLVLKVPYVDRLLQKEISKITEGSEFNGIVIVLSDITAQSQEHLEMKHSFIEGLSSDLLKRIDAVKSGLEIIRKSEVESPISLLNISENLLKEIKSIEDLSLDINRIAGELASPQEQMAWDIVHLDRLLEETIKGLSDYANKANVHIEGEISPSLSPILGDAKLLQLVFYNLIRNAIRYSPPLEPVFISLSEKSDEIYFSVQHGGKGLTSEEIKKIFDKPLKFAQPQFGKVINLAMIKDIITMHNGDIWVESQPDRWTRFNVVLKKEPQAIAVKRRYEQREALRPIAIKAYNRLLMVEDQSEIRAFLRKIAEDNQFEITTINTADDLATYVQLSENLYLYFNVLSTSINLFDLTKILKNRKLKGKVLLTAFLPDPEKPKEKLLHGIDEFFPTDEQMALLELIRKKLRHLKSEEGENNVLIISDKKDIYQLFKSHFRSKKYKFLYVDNFKKAVETLFIKEIKLIILDYLVAMRNGFELIFLLKEHKTTQKIPIFMLVGEEFYPRAKNIEFSFLFIGEKKAGKERYIDFLSGWLKDERT